MRLSDAVKKTIFTVGVAFLCVMLLLIYPDFNEHKAYQRSTMPSLNRQLRSLGQLQLSGDSITSTPEEAAALRAQVEDMQAQLRQVIAEDSVILRRLSAKINILLAGVLLFAVLFFIAGSFLNR
ncbi:MAG: hypothetical protein PHR11_03215 [Candidatus Omnitrophica bacterium]|nr:hypothetical protein [Candidatus Omnitrophota bacterium]